MRTADVRMLMLMVMVHTSLLGMLYAAEHQHILTWCNIDSTTKIVADAAAKSSIGLIFCSVCYPYVLACEDLLAVSMGSVL